MRTVGSLFALYAGDTNHDGKISYNGAANDRVAMLRIVGLSTSNNQADGYYSEDANMDGIVRYNGSANDRLIVLGIVGLSTTNNIIFQQY